MSEKKGAIAGLGRGRKVRPAFASFCHRREGSLQASLEGRSALGHPEQVERIALQHRRRLARFASLPRK